jgi:hypothetical protein
MVGNLVQALLIVVILYVGVLILKSYKPEWFSEGFTTQKPKILAAAPPPVEVAPPAAPRVIAPGGPAPPAAAAPPAPPTRSPEEQPRDPYDEVNGKIPIEDNLRHPENSFSPGIRNTGTTLAETAGIASRDTATAMQTFSPEFAQNGGEFMPGIVAAGEGGDEYALV